MVFVNTLSTILHEASKTISYIAGYVTERISMLLGEDTIGAISAYGHTRLEASYLGIKELSRQAQQVVIGYTSKWYTEEHQPGPDCKSVDEMGQCAPPEQDELDVYQIFHDFFADSYVLVALCVLPIFLMSLTGARFVYYQLLARMDKHVRQRDSSGKGRVAAVDWLRKTRASLAERLLEAEKESCVECQLLHARILRSRPAPMYECVECRRQFGTDDDDEKAALQVDHDSGDSGIQHLYSYTQKHAEDQANIKEVEEDECVECRRQLARYLNDACQTDGCVECQVMLKSGGQAMQEKRTVMESGDAGEIKTGDGPLNNDVMSNATGVENSGLVISFNVADLSLQELIKLQQDDGNAKAAKSTGNKWAWFKSNKSCNKTATTDSPLIDDKPVAHGDGHEIEDVLDDYDSVSEVTESDETQTGSTRSSAGDADDVSGTYDNTEMSANPVVMDYAEDIVESSFLDMRHDDTSLDLQRAEDSDGVANENLSDTSNHDYVAFQAASSAAIEPIPNNELPEEAGGINSTTTTATATITRSTKRNEQMMGDGPHTLLTGPNTESEHISNTDGGRNATSDIL